MGASYLACKKQCGFGDIYSCSKRCLFCFKYALDSWHIAQNLVYEERRYACLRDLGIFRDFILGRGPLASLFGQKLLIK